MSLRYMLLSFRCDAVAIILSRVCLRHVQNGWLRGKRKQRTAVEKENQRLYCRVTEARQHPGNEGYKGNLKGRENTPSWRGSITSNRKDKWL